jgi:hypothetical protein
LLLRLQGRRQVISELLDLIGSDGFLYYDIFPAPSMMQFGGLYPWANRNRQEFICADLGLCLKLVASRVGITKLI